MGVLSHKEPCAKCRAKGRDINGDNLAVYTDGSSYCWSCGFTVPSEAWLLANGKKTEWYYSKEDEEVMSKEKLTKEELAQIKEYTGEKGHNLRGITDETYGYFKVRHKYSEETGEPTHQYYPVTTGYEASGYKIRELPKKFSSIGLTGKDADLFGQWRAKNANGKFVVITAGECFKGDTEVLTDTGFVPFNLLEKGVKVLQVKDDKTGEFVVPLAYVEKQYEGELITLTSAKFKVTATPGHRIVSENARGEEFIHPISDHFPATRNIRLCAKSYGEGTGLSKDQIALTLAVCADSKIDVRKSGLMYAHFGLIKERKIIRLKGILDRLGQKYTSYTSLYSNGKTYTTFNLTLPKYISGKVIPAEWISAATEEEKDFILEELRWWDGNEVLGRTYTEFSSKHYSEVSTIQALCITSGRYSSVRYRSNKYGEWFVVSIHSKELMGGTQQLKRASEHFNGMVYCVSVPSGKIVIRQEGKVMVIGNCDCMSAHQMLEDYRKSKGSDFDPIPCVSPTIGESGSDKQISKHYEWFDRFDKIIVCYDMDAAGKEATQKLVSVLPKGKMYVMELPAKDTNKMLEEGMAKKWVDCFWKAKPYTPDGIVGSSTLSSKIREYAAIKKIPLPPFMHRVQGLMAGGIPLGVILCLGSSSGSGKSTFTDEMLYYWIFNSPHKVGIISLESDSGAYATKLLSRHIGKKIDLIADEEAKVEFLNTPEVIEQEKFLFADENGQDRFYLIEDRDNGWEAMKSSIMNLIVSCEVKVIVLDPLQDAWAGMTLEQQEKAAAWLKGSVKSHGVTYILINHVRKNSGGNKANSQGADLTEEDFHGSSSIFKSSACNLLFMRNKEDEDEIGRNTTVMKLSKCRWSGMTSPFAGKFYYDNETHSLHDFDDFFAEQHGGDF